MREPDLVGDCVSAMKNAVDIPVTVKCRIGVDDQNPQQALDELHKIIQKAGCDAWWVHARKAWLQGLSPKENRDIPPLDYERVNSLKSDNPNSYIGINGGFTSVESVKSHLDAADGVMIGRAAYQNPIMWRTTW